MADVTPLRFYRTANTITAWAEFQTGETINVSYISGLGDAATKNVGTTTGTVAHGDHTHSEVYQPLDGDLTSISGLSDVGTGFLKKTGTNTWTLDSNTYITGNQSITVSGDVSGSGTTSIVTTVDNIKGFPLPGTLIPGIFMFDGQQWSLEDNLCEACIEPGTTGQYFRGDKTWQDLHADVVSFTSTGLLESTNVQDAIIEADYNRMNQYSGAVGLPTITDNGNGTITVGEGTYNLYTSMDGYGICERYTIAGDTFTLTDSKDNYIYADYNDGSPCIKCTANRSDISTTFLTTKMIIATVGKYGSVVKYLYWADQGIAKPEKLLARAIETQRFVRDATIAGLTLTDEGSRVFKVSAGGIWYGTIDLALDQAVSNTADLCQLWYYDGTDWHYNNVTQYDNSHYQGTNGLENLGLINYTTNFIFRGVEQDVSGNALDTLYILLSNDEYLSASAALAAPIPVKPFIIDKHAVLVGIIAVYKGASTNSGIKSAFETTFATVTSTDHLNLSNLQGGTTGEYYHLSYSQYGLATQNATATLTGLLSSTDWSTFNGKQSALNGNGLVRMSGTSVSYDNTSYADDSNVVHKSGNEVDIGGNKTWTGLHIFSNTEASTSTSTGAIVLSGSGAGIGLSGSVNAGLDSSFNDVVAGKAVGGLQLPSLSANPSAPTSGNIVLYNDKITGRLSLIQSTGLDRPIPVDAGYSHSAVVIPIAGSTNFRDTIGISSSGAYSIATISTSNTRTRQVRQQQISASGTNRMVSNYGTVGVWTIGTGSGLGGFHYRCRFAIGDSTIVANTRLFVGLTASMSAPSNVEPSSLTNVIGIGEGATNNNLFLYYGGSSAQTPINLGSNFPTNVNTECYILELFSDPYTTDIKYRVIRVGTSYVATGTIANTTPGTTLPASTTLLTHAAFRATTSTSGTVILDTMGINIEQIV